MTEQEIPLGNTRPFIASLLTIQRYDEEIVQEPWGGEYADMVEQSNGMYVRIQDVEKLIEIYFKKEK